MFPSRCLLYTSRVRQALLHATNARQVVETLFSANYPQATSVLASSAAGYVNLSDKPVSYTHLDVYKRQPQAKTSKAVTAGTVARGDCPPA